VSGEDRESAFLFQRFSVNIQRFNSELLHESFADDVPVMYVVTPSLLFLTLWIYTTKGAIKIIIIMQIKLTSASCIIHSNATNNYNNENSNNCIRPFNLG